MVIVYVMKNYQFSYIGKHKIPVKGVFSLTDCCSFVQIRWQNIKNLGINCQNWAGIVKLHHLKLENSKLSIFCGKRCNYFQRLYVCTDLSDFRSRSWFWLAKIVRIGQKLQRYQFLPTSTLAKVGENLCFSVSFSYFICNLVKIT